MELSSRYLDKGSNCRAVICRLIGLYCQLYCVAGELVRPRAQSTQYVCTLGLQGIVATPEVPSR